MARLGSSQNINERVIEGTKCLVIENHRDTNGSSTPTLNLSWDTNEIRTGLHLIEFVAKEGKFGDNFVLCTTNREEIGPRSDITKLKNGETLWILHSLDQVLTRSSVEKVNITPHFENIFNSVTRAYLASPHMKSLPIALAELVDNSLSATKENHFDGKKRQIGICYYRDSVNQSKSVLVVTDNGCGMTTEELTNWARFKQPKGFRKESQLSDSPPRKTRRVASSGTNRETQGEDQCPRFLNSNLSLSGAGGKHGAFFLGNRVRIISLSRKSVDVKEIEISQEDFQKKENSGEAVYRTKVISRCVGSTENAAENSTFGLVVRKHIEQEAEYGDSFTFVFITNMRNDDHQLDDLKDLNSEWQAQLAHIYHYYLHGPLGNIEDKAAKEKESPQFCRNIEIDFKGYKIPANFRRQGASKKLTSFHEINFRDIDYDSQTIYIRKAQSEFEFKGKDFNGSGKLVEGVVRYYPFLYSCESYPGQIYGRTGVDESDSSPNEERVKSMFESYWNGRLIPNSPVPTLNWMKIDKSSAMSPKKESFDRLAGVIFCNNGFSVTQSKTKFQVPPEGSLNNENSSVLCDALPVVMSWSFKLNNVWIDNGIQEAFRGWLNGCHASLDKKIQFHEFDKVVTKPDENKNRQYPWSLFNKLTWDCKTYKVGDLIPVIKKKLVIIGRITGFLLFGAHNQDFSERTPIYGGDGFFKLDVLPKLMAENEMYIPLADVDRNATAAEIKSILDTNTNRLPAKMRVDFVDRTVLINDVEVTKPRAPISEGEQVPPGHVIGAFQVDVVDKNGASVKGLIPGSKKKITVKFILLHNNCVKNTFVSNVYSSAYAYWFEHIGDNMTELGNWTIRIEASIKTGSIEAREISGGIPLPSWERNFVVIPGEVAYVSVDGLDGEFSRVGEPFSIPISFEDLSGHKTSPPEEYDAIITSKDFTFSHSGTFLRGNKLVIDKVVGKGKIGDQNMKDVKFEVLLVSKGEKKHPFKPCEISCLFRAGKPAELDLFPGAVEKIRIGNGTLPRSGAKVFTVVRDQPINIRLQLYDAYGNQTTDENVPTMLGISKHLKLSCAKKMHTDRTGAADYGETLVSFHNDDQPTIDCPLSVCSGKCYGIFAVQAKATYNGEDLRTTRQLNLHVKCTRSFKLNVECDAHIDEDGIIATRIVASRMFPTFLLTMEDENGLQISDSTLQTQDVKLVTRPSHTSDTRELKASSFSEDGKWTFKKRAPKAAGDYLLQLVYQSSDGTFIQSQQFKLTVECDYPKSFMPRQLPMQRRATNGANIQSRTLISPVELVVRDSHGNAIGKHLAEDQAELLNGALTVKIVDMEGNFDENTTPKFVSNKSEEVFKIVKGRVEVSRLSLEENTSGMNNATYKLVFHSSFPNLNLCFKPYEFPFRFFNDLEMRHRQAKIGAEKLKVDKTLEEAVVKKATILAAIDKVKYVKIPERTNVNNFMGNWRTADPQTIKELGLTPQTTAEQVAELISQVQDRLRELELRDEQRREDLQPISIAPALIEPGVLGKLCHLAIVDDPADALIISWHLQDDMDTIVTLTVDKLKELCERYHRRQQLLSIESIFKGNLDWHKMMPHEYLTYISVTGNPVLARRLLKFPRDEVPCRTVFACLLGETIIIDTLDDALSYRDQIVKFAPCPTIITRDGNRLRHDGQITSSGNINQLGSQLSKGVFGLAPHPDIEKLTKVINNLMTHHKNLLKLRAAIASQTELRAAQQVELDKLGAQIEECGLTISKFDAELQDISRCIQQLQQFARC